MNKPTLDLMTVEGYSELVSWYGGKPTFHDSFLFELKLSSLLESQIILRFDRFAGANEQPSSAFVVWTLRTIEEVNTSGKFDLGEILAFEVDYINDRYLIQCDGNTFGFDIKCQGLRVSFTETRGFRWN